MTNNKNINGANDFLGGFVTSSLIAVVSLFSGKHSAANHYTCRKEGAGARNLQDKSPPKVIVPKQSSETLKPLFPNNLYRIVSFLLLIVPVSVTDSRQTSYFLTTKGDKFNFR